MTQQTITLQHSLVNSGTAVTLPSSTTISYKWKNLTNFNPAVGKWDIVPGNFQGFENPTIQIKIPLSTIETSTNELTHKLLVDFSILRSTTPITLSIPTSSSGSTENPFSATPTYLGGRPSGGYKTDGTNTLSNTIYIFINGFSIDIDSSSELGHIWNITIDAQEAI